MSYDKKDKLHIVTVVAVIGDGDGRYLVLKRRDNEIAYPGMYTFPGGKVEGNDTVEETLAKEVAEEAGLKLKVGKILLKDKSFVRPDGQTAKSFSYLCEVEGRADVAIDADFTDFKWVNIEELNRLPHVGIEEELVRAEDFYKKGFTLDAFSTKSVKQSQEEVEAMKDLKN